MENETKITIKLPADLLADVKLKAEKSNTTVSSLVRNFLLAYIEHDNDFSCDRTNPIYSYHENAKKKQELKENISKARTEFKDVRSNLSDLKQKSTLVSLARAEWHNAVEDYNTFCTNH
jgi:hypothetical protein